MWQELKPGGRGRTGPGAVQPGRHRGRSERRLARPLAIASLAGLLAAGGLTVTACTPQTAGANSGQVTSPATVTPTTSAPTAPVTATPTVTATAIVTATAAP